MKKRIAVNAVLNVIKSGLSILFPLITYPYALRVLGAENIGKISYSLSVVSYFALIAKFGISSYAAREGAGIKEDKEKFRDFSNQIFTLNMLCTVVAYIALFATLFSVGNLSSYKYLIIIHSISMLCTTIGIEWINTIFEDFLSVTMRSIFSYIVTLAMLFIFVREPRDYVIYAGISVFANIIVSVFNWFYCKRYVRIRIVFSKQMFSHLKYMVVFFLSGITVSIYVNLDVTMLGWMKGDYSVGIYTISTKIYNILKELLAAIYVVAIPRLAYYFSKKDLTKYRELFSVMTSVIVIILLPVCAGVIAVAKEIILFMGGTEYLPGALTLQILSVSLMFAIFGGLLTACLNVTIGCEKNNLVATAISALLNFVLNIFFIRNLSFHGAAITTCIAEMFVFIYCFACLENREQYIDFKYILKNILQALSGCLIIFLVKTVCDMLPLDTMVVMVIKIFVSILFYGILLVTLKNPVLHSFIREIRKWRARG